MKPDPRPVLSTEGDTEIGRYGKHLTEEQYLAREPEFLLYVDKALPTTEKSSTITNCATRNRASAM